MKFTAISALALIIIGIVGVQLGSVILAVLFFLLLMLMPLISGWELKRSCKEPQNDNE